MKKIIVFITFTIFSLQAIQIITQPGKYTIGASLRYAPTAPNESIIYITTSDVTLDLGNNIITQDGFISGLNGIEISSSLNNITIQNGTIQNITGTGILVHEGCTNITLSNITTLSCDTCAIDLSGSITNPISSGWIDKCMIMGCCQKPSNANVIHISYGQQINVNNCQCNNNGSAATSLQVIRLESCVGCIFNTISMSNNMAGSRWSGFSLNNTSNCQFNNCLSQGNITYLSNALNISFDLENSSNCTGNLFTDCTALSNTATTQFSAAKAFSVLATNDDNIFQNCQALFNNSDDLTASFTVALNNRNLFIECVSDQTLSATSCQGFDLGQCNACSLIRCNVLNTDGFIATGINLANCSNCIITSCNAANQAGSFRSNGIVNSRGNQNIFNANSAARNRGPVVGRSFGFILSNDTSSAYIKNQSLRNGTVTANQYSGFGGTQTSVQSVNTPNSITQPWTNMGLL